MKIKYLLIVLLLTSILSVKPAVASAEQVQLYYQNLFSSWGVNVTNKISPLKADNTTASEILEPNNENTEQTTNQDVTISTKNNVNYILVKDYPLEYIIKGQRLDLGFTNYKGAQAYAYYWRDSATGTKKYFILEEYLYTPQYREYIRDYVKALNKSLNNQSSNTSSLITKSQSISALDKLKIKDSLLETAMYIFTILIIICLFLGLILKLAKQKNREQLVIELKNSYKEIKTFLIKIRPYSLLILISYTIILFAVLAVLLINYKDKDLSSLMISYISLYSDIEALKALVINKTLIVTFGISAFTLFIILLAIYLIPSILFIIEKSAHQFKSEKIKSSANKFIFPFCILSALFLVMFSDLNNFVMPTFLILIAVFMLLKGFYNHATVSYSKRNKIMILLSFVIIFLTGSVYSSTKQNQPKIITDIIFASPAKVIFYPYRQELKDGTNQVKQNEHIAGLFNIFAQNYMIYSPKYPNISNKNISELNNLPNDTPALIIPASDEDKMLESFYTNELLRTLYSSPQQDSNTQYFKNSWSYNDYFTTEIKINCSTDIPATEMAYKVIKPGDESDEMLTKDQFLVLYFPGCRTNDVESFIVPILEPIYEGSYLFKLKDDNSNTGSSFEISKNGNRILSSEYLFFDNNVKEINSSMDSKSEAVNVYSINKINPIDFNNKISDMIDISDNINKLLKENSLSNVFTFWSNEVNAYVRNDQQKE